jgi:hypothetical protein
MRRGPIVLGIVLLAGVAVIPVVNWRVEEYVRSRAIEELRRRYGSDLLFSSLDVRVLPGIRVTGRDLVFHKDGRRDVPPFISIKRLEARAGLAQMLWSPKHVRRVTFEGLLIQIPPGKDDGGEPEEPPKPDQPDKSPVVVDELVCDGAVVRILPRKAGREPKDWEIHELRMESVGLDRPAPFRARLRNATPPGDIRVEGDFGPWQRENAGRTPLGAKYEFRNANLDHFKGIGGILSSTGKFKGVLERIEVDGETHTPDFVVDISGQPVPLHTKFHAIVDGTNGETLLKPVRARVLNTTIVADGGVVETPGRKGRTVKLDVKVEGGRIEDLMRLALKSLAGRFGLASAKFTSPGIQDKIADLSDKGRGEPRTDTPSDRVASDFRGVFRLGGGVIRFRDLAFRVPGAGVFLNGSYGL